MEYRENRFIFLQGENIYVFYKLDLNLAFISSLI